MITKLKIKNFKSIKDLSLDCRKINIFIGEPNAGKSNILEALGLFSFAAYGKELKEFVRYEKIINLFFDNEISNPIEITVEDLNIEIFYQDGNVLFFLEPPKLGESFLGEKFFIEERKEFFRYSIDKGVKSRTYLEGLPKKFKFYRFNKEELFTSSDSAFLMPPFGKNLLTVLQTHKEVRTIVSELLNNFNYQLLLEPFENKIKIIKRTEEVFVSFPYTVISDTLQRIIFYMTALLSNKDSILMFEEPESHAFPYYTKYLAECIAFDKTNQFFISTHNPYFLISVLEKAQKEDIQVIIVYMKDFVTKIRVLSEDEIEESLNEGIDLFFNLERFLEDEDCS